MRTIGIIVGWHGSPRFKTAERRSAEKTNAATLSPWIDPVNGNPPPALKK